MFPKLNSFKSKTILACGILTQIFSINTAYAAEVAVIDPKISGVSTVCKGGTSVLEVSIKEGNDYASFQWQISTDNVHFTDIEGATNQRFTTPNLNTTTFFRVSVLGGETGIIESSEVLPITVVAPPSVQLVTEGTNTSNGGDITLKALLNGGVGCSIQWHLSQDNGKTWEVIENETSEFLKVGYSKMSNNVYRAIAKCQGNGCCD